MANQPSTTNSPLKSKNFWSGIITIITAAFLGFGITVDASGVDTLTQTGTQVYDAIAQKNWLAAGLVLVNSANVLFHLFKTWFGKQDAK